MERNICCGLIATVVGLFPAHAATISAAPSIVQMLYVHKNPLYGKLTPEDVALLQRCKDELVARVSDRSARSPRLAESIARAELGAADFLAAAIERCAREAADDDRGLHVTASPLRTGAPLLK